MDIEKKDITAIIPVRKETKLLNKNMLPFNGTNLLVHKIRQLKQVEEIKQIVVSSEDEVMLMEARKEGVVYLERPYEYAKKDCPFGKYVEYICSKVEGTHILWACVTSPLVDVETYKESIQLYFEKLKEGYDSFITVQEHKRFLMDKNGSINFKRGLGHKNSEDLPEIYIFTNGVVLAPREKMIEWKYNWGYIPYKMKVDKCIGIDINDEFDYEIAKFMWDKKKQEQSR